MLGARSESGAMYITLTLESYDACCLLRLYSSVIANTCEVKPTR